MKKNHPQWWYWFVFQPFFWCWSIARVQAQVVINELYPNPNTNEDEWIELYNNNEQVTDLAGWELWDQLSTPSKTFSFTAETKLNSQEFLIIPLINKLNNGGDIVILKDANGQEINRLEYTDSTKGKSWARDPTNLTEIFLTEPTKGEANPEPTSSGAAYNGINPELSEVMVCPADSDEWIELYNPHDQSINLVDFSLRDNKAVIYSFTDEIIDDQKWLTIDLHNVLNNGGDTVTLISPDNQIVESFSYTTCQDSASWVKGAGEWEQTEIITKNAANIFSLDPSPTASATNNSINNSTNDITNNSANNLTITENSPAVLSAFTDDFHYPLTVLKPKLTYDKSQFFAQDNVVFLQSPALEKGAFSVIMGSLLLLIPGLIYVKNRQQNF